MNKRTKDGQPPGWSVPFASIIFALIVLGLFIRTYEIDLRPLHSDEGVNFHFLNELRSTSLYRYSYENYHGPAYFQLSALLQRLTGSNELGLRSSSILVGALLPLLFVPWSRIVGGIFLLLGTALIGSSPSMVFYSRYAIHEMLFCFASSWLAVECFLIFVNYQYKRAYPAALALALLVATKETYVILGFCLLVAILSTGEIKQKVSFLKEHARHFMASFLLFMFATIASYSSGFRYFSGVRELLLGVIQWVVRGTKSDPGHFKPFSYYMLILWEAEPHLLIGLPALAILLIYCRIVSKKQTAKKVSMPVGNITVGNDTVERNNSRPLLLYRYVFFWALSSLICYSAIPYKTPWLIVNISLPLILCLSLALGFIATRRRNLRVLALGLAVFAVLFSFSRAWAYNFGGQTIGSFDPSLKQLEPFGPSNPYSYVHTSPGMLHFVDDMNKYLASNPDSTVLIGVGQYWPLPFYLGRLNVRTAYFVPEKLEDNLQDYSIVAINRGREWNLQGWEKRFYRFSDVQESEVYFKPLSSNRPRSTESVQ